MKPRPEIVTADHHPDYIRVIKSPDLRASFFDANRQLDNNDVRGVVWIPEVQPVVAPDFDGVLDATGRTSINNENSERPLDPNRYITSTYERNTSTTHAESLSYDPNRPDADPRKPHLAGIEWNGGSWEGMPPVSRRCIHTAFAENESSGTIFHDRVVKFDNDKKGNWKTDLLNYEGNVKKKHLGDLGRAWQLSSGSALFMRVGGMPEGQLLNNAAAMRVTDKAAKHPPRITRVVESYDYDWKPSQTWAL
jgi:hypothetical protein